MHKNVLKTAKKRLKLKNTDYDTIYMNELFKEMADWDAKKLKHCRTCVHRKRYALNEHSTKVVQCCELQPSKRSNSGLKTIKVTNPACAAYKEEK